MSIRFKLAGTAMIALSAAANAQEVPPLADLVRDAALVFVGDVVSVDYRIAEGSGMPHTFVTYQPLEVIRGEAPAKLVLRFAGGSDGRGEFLFAGDVPLFGVGQRDALLVEGGDLAPCPLTACEAGRFRIVDGRVYDVHGHPVGLTEKDIAIGDVKRDGVDEIEIPTPSFSHLMENPDALRIARIEAERRGVSIEELGRLYDRERPRSTVIASAADEPEKSADEADAESAESPRIEPVTADAFVARLQRIAAAAPPPLEAVLALDPDAPFEVPSDRPVRPVLAEPVEPRPSLDEEARREHEFILEQNDGRLLRPLSKGDEVLPVPESAERLHQ